MTFEGERSVGRGVVLIILVGTALGLAHNWVGRASRPPRGIAWRATPATLPDLESLTPSGSDGGIPAGEAPTDSAIASRVGSHSSATAGGDRVAATPSAPAHDAARSSPSTLDRRSGHVPVLLTDRQPEASTSTPPPASTGGSASGTTASRVTGPLPFIPDTDQPVQVKLGLVKRFFDAGAALFIDARDPTEFEAGHIPGAVRMAQADAAADPDRVKALPVRGRAIIVYCEGGECEASLEMARVLIEAGYRKVLVYMGGFPEWAAAGHPVERGSGRS